MLDVATVRVIYRVLVLTIGDVQRIQFDVNEIIMTGQNECDQLNFLMRKPTMFFFFYRSDTNRAVQAH